MEDEEKERREDGTLSKEPRTKSRWQQVRKIQSLEDQVTKTKSLKDQVRMTQNLKPCVLHVSAITILGVQAAQWAVLHLISIHHS